MVLRGRWWGSEQGKKGWRGSDQKTKDSIEQEKVLLYALTYSIHTFRNDRQIQSSMLLIEGVPFTHLGMIDKQNRASWELNDTIHSFRIDKQIQASVSEII